LLNESRILLDQVIVSLNVITFGSEQRAVFAKQSVMGIDLRIIGVDVDPAPSLLLCVEICELSLDSCHALVELFEFIN
jgi:hypothetical protein